MLTQKLLDFAQLLMVCIKNIVIGLAPNPTIYYISKEGETVLKNQTKVNILKANFAGACIGIVGSYSDTALRAMISMCVPKHELGKVFSMMSSLNCALGLFFPQIFKSIFTVKSIIKKYE